MLAFHVNRFVLLYNSLAFNLTVSGAITIIIADKVHYYVSGGKKKPAKSIYQQLLLRSVPWERRNTPADRRRRRRRRPIRSLPRRVIRTSRCAACPVVTGARRFLGRFLDRLTGPRVAYSACNRRRPPPPPPRLKRICR